jgi:foldase protein PrsA
MKNIKKIVNMAVACVFALSFTGCSLVAKTPQAIAKSPVAKVGGEYITRSELDSNPAYMQQLTQLKTQSPDVEKTDAGKAQIKQLKQQVLDQMISEKVVLQQAKKLNINTDDKTVSDEVQKQFDDIKKGFSDDQKFQDALKQAGYTEQTLKANIKDRVIEQKVMDAATKEVTVSDDEAKKYYDANPYSYTEKPNMIKLAHILVASQDEANKVEERLKNGEDFGKLAKELSTDTGSKDKGGEYEVPYVGSGFDETFMKAALAQKEGQISQPVQTQFGYHVIKTIKKTEYPVKPFDSVKEDIKKTLLDQDKQTAFQKKLDQWKKDAQVETKKYENNLV